jgi:plastocyanin
MRRRAAVLLITWALLLLNAFVSLPAYAGGCHPESTQPSSESAGTTAIVPTKGCAFGPTVLHVSEGATVTWVNHDPVPHTVTGVNLTWGGLDELGKGEDVRFQFDESGTFPYYCILHPGMAGAVVVGNGRSDDIAAAPVAMPPSGTKSAPKPTSDEGSAAGTSTASVAGIAVLALVAGVGAGMAIRSRTAGHPKQLPQT